MTPAARISAAIEVLGRVFDGLPAEQALTRWARGARYAGSKDRAAVRDHVFQALRCRRSYAALGGGADGRAVMIGALRADGADPATLFTGEGHAPAPLTEDEWGMPDVTLSEAEDADLPDWLWRVFEEDLGGQAKAQAQAQTSRAPVAMRVNLKIKNASQAIEILKDDGIEAHRVDGLDIALIATEGARRIRGSKAYLSGLVELQDVSSQSAMGRITLPLGARVLDYCAGGGGKTLALAAMVPAGPPHAQFFAYDADPGRMTDLPSRAARAGVKVAVLEAGDIARHAPFDVVLCDVPCSGSGTWRRSPEAKWKLTLDRLQNLIDIQRDILHSSSNLLAAGGQLIYTTCSILNRENAAQIDAFCQTYPEFERQDQHHWPVTDTGDGFFFASMIRRN
ncbi:MAG: RsmB/NOP family class I SAM-dependent RNA methyltransferase [Pseudomonadota bacterium]